MEQAEVVAVIQDAVYTVLIVAGPMLISGMVVGMIISIFQATTQISEQTLSFVPKIVAILIALVLTIANSISVMKDFVLRMYSYIDTMIG